MEKGPKFDKKGVCRFKNDQNQIVILHKSIWLFKTTKPERQHLAYNFEKLKSTVRTPDKIRKSKKEPDTLLYYKKFSEIWLQPNIKVPNIAPHMCVIVGKRNNARFVKSFYTTRRIK